VGGTVGVVVGVALLIFARPCSQLPELYEDVVGDMGDADEPAASASSAPVGGGGGYAH
jgi:hypothetical protein